MGHGRAGWVVVAVALAAAARGAVVDFDMRGLLDADVIVNDGTGTVDPTQQAIDLGVIASGNFAFMTESAARRLSPGLTPDGLPDDAFFPADPYHPDVQLWWNNADDGDNARRLAAAVGTFVITPPAQRYAEVHLYATGGDGDASVTVTLAYDDGTTASSFIVVPDWFDDPPITPDLYRLVDGRDRIQPGSGPGIPFGYEDSNDPAIFGFRFPADPTRILERVQVDRTDTTGVLNVFGAIGITLPTGPDLYESAIPQGLLDPANVVATGVTSPFPWTPPPDEKLLCYFIDDLAGSPALIFVAKDPGGIVFDF